MLIQRNKEEYIETSSFLLNGRFQLVYWPVWKIQKLMGVHVE